VRTYHLDTRPIPLESSRVALRPVELNDYPALFKMTSRAEATYRWRFRGATPSPEDFRELLWRGVLGQFVIARRGAPGVVGLVTAYDVDFPNQTAHLAVLVDEEHRGRGWPLEGVVLFLNYLFEHWPFRKLYADALEFNATTYLSGAKRLFEVEGTLRKHEYYQERYWDLLVLAVYRERWEAMRHRYLPILNRIDRDA